MSALKCRMPSESFSVAIWSSFSIQRKVFSSSEIFFKSLFFAASGSSLRTSLPSCVGQFFQQFRRDREQIATGQFGNFAGVAEAGPHDFGFVAEFLVVAVNVRDRFHAGIFRWRESNRPPCDFLYQS